MGASGHLELPLAEWVDMSRYYFASSDDIYFAAELVKDKADHDQSVMRSWHLHDDPAEIDLPDNLYVFLDEESPLKIFDFYPSQVGILSSQKFVDLLIRFKVKHRKASIEFVDLGGGGIANARPTFFVIIDDFVDCVDIDRSDIEYLDDASEFDAANINAIRNVEFKDTGLAFFKAADLPNHDWIASDDFKAACEQDAIINVRFSKPSEIVIARNRLGLLATLPRPASREKLAQKALEKRRKKRKL